MGEQHPPVPRLSGLSARGSVPHLQGGFFVRSRATTRNAARERRRLHHTSWRSMPKQSTLISACVRGYNR